VVFRRNSSHFGLALVFAIVLFISLVPHGSAVGQASGLLQIDDPAYRFLERQQTAGLLPGAILVHRPLSASAATAYLESLRSVADQMSTLDQQRLAVLLYEEDAPGAGWIRDRIPFLYTNGSDLYSARGEGWRVALNPAAYASLGRASSRMQSGQELSDARTFRNTRGVHASGQIGDHLFFESRIEENQVRRPFTPSTGFTAPRLGYTKTTEDGTLDQFVAMGMVGASSRFFEVRFGRDRNRWADGMTSLLLSDYSTVYDQLQLRTTFWRIQYVNLFARFTNRTGIDPHFHNSNLPRKHGAFHQLSIDLPGRVQVSFFEAVIFAPDSIRGTGFDIAYLNPIMFLRPVEHDLGSPDNMMIGAGASWIARRGLKLYGQGFLTELRLEELFAGDGWYGNKYGVLGGFHVVDLPVDNLDVRFEISRVRPFAYAHFDPATAYVHYEDVLGHPAGQNVDDYALFLNYEPGLRWRFAANVARTFRGRDPEGENWGGDPRLSYYDAAHHYDVRMLHGVRVDEWLIEAFGGYQLLPRLHLEGSLRVLSSDDQLDGMTRYVEPGVQLRWGIPFKSTRW
jgi:hypothetical protein